MSMRQGFKFVPKLLNVDRKPSQPKNKKKFALVFDEEKRREFLTGFRKRKLQRKQKAIQELEVRLKEEKKRIKKETKEKFKKLVSQRDVPELEELLCKAEQKYETEGKTVSILELDVNKLRQSDNWIGENKPTYENDTTDNDEESDEESDTVPGMELKKKPKFVEEKKNKLNLSKKELSRAVQKETLLSIKNNKVFQRKQRLQRTKNKKLATREKIMKERSSKFVKGKKKNKKFSRNES